MPIELEHVTSPTADARALVAELDVAARGDEAFRDTMKGYMDKVIADMDRHISTDWFELTPNGLAELHA